MYFCTLYPSIDPKERCRQASDRLPLVSNFLTKIWMQNYDGARLSSNSVLNAVWHALNEPVCQYLRKRNPHYSTVYIDNSLGPLARDSHTIMFTVVSPPGLGCVVKNMKLIKLSGTKYRLCHAQLNNECLYAFCNTTLLSKILQK